jgi:hypothetical protein
MSRWIAAAAFLALSLPIHAQADTMDITPYKATYQGSVSIGSLACQMTLEHNADGSYTFRSVSHAIGFAAMFVKDVITETSRFDMVDGRPRSLEYSYTRKGGKHDKSETIQFDWNNRTALTVENSQSKTTPLIPGVADRFLTQLILSLDAESGKLQDEYKVLDHRDISRFTPQQPQDKSLSVPAGGFDTLMVERQDKGSKRVMDFWFAPKLHYLPVQIQQREPGEDTYTLSLTSSSFDIGVPTATSKD